MPHSNTHFQSAAITYPNHIAFIVDGNRRWGARAWILPQEAHQIGFNNILSVDLACMRRGIKWRSYFVFSAENLMRRARAESENFMTLTAGLIDSLKHVSYSPIIHLVGDLADVRLTPDLIALAATINPDHALGHCKDNVVIFMNFCGSQLVRSTDAPSYGHRCLEHVPPIDVVVRTGGEQRLSGFVMGQISFSELFFVDTWWPDFDEDRLDAVCVSFGDRSRRFGS